MSTRRAVRPQEPPPSSGSSQTAFTPVAVPCLPPTDPAIEFSPERAVAHFVHNGERRLFDWEPRRKGGDAILTESDRDEFESRESFLEGQVLGMPLLASLVGSSFAFAERRFDGIVADVAAVIDDDGGELDWDDDLVRVEKERNALLRAVAEARSGLAVLATKVSEGSDLFVARGSGREDDRGRFAALTRRLAAVAPSRRASSEDRVVAAVDRPWPRPDVIVPGSADDPGVGFSAGDVVMVPSCGAARIFGTGVVLSPDDRDGPLRPLPASVAGRLRGLLAEEVSTGRPSPCDDRFWHDGRLWWRRPWSDRVVDESPAEGVARLRLWSASVFAPVLRGEDPDRLAGASSPRRHPWRAGVKAMWAHRSPGRSAEVLQRLVRSAAGAVAPDRCAAPGPYGNVSEPDRQRRHRLGDWRYAPVAGSWDREWENGGRHDVRWLAEMLSGDLLEAASTVLLSERVSADDVGRFLDRLDAAIADLPEAARRVGEARRLALSSRDAPSALVAAARREAEEQAMEETMAAALAGFDGARWFRAVADASGVVLCEIGVEDLLAAVHAGPPGAGLGTSLPPRPGNDGEYTAALLGADHPRRVGAARAAGLAAQRSAFESD